MNKLFLMPAAALAVALMLSAAPAVAADFAFDVDLEGDGDVTWDFQNEVTTDYTVNAGSEFTFGGGAGADGEATANGQWTGVGALFGEYGYGSGDAYSNTAGGNYAEANYHSGSGALAGGFAADANFNGDPSKMKFSSIITNGGAGSAETGLTYGTNTAYGNTGSLTYDVDADLHFEYIDTP